MRLTKLAALSLLLATSSATIPLERATAQAAPPPAGQGAPPTAAPATPPPASPATPPPAAAAPAGSPPAVTHSSVNLRNGPGTSFTVITLIPAGTSVEVHECKSGWCEATFQGQNGYIIESSIAPGDPAAARARPRPGPGYGAGYYAGGPPPGPGYDEPPPGYYPPPPPAYGYYGYPYGGGPYYGGYWGWHRGYWRRW